MPVLKPISGHGSCVPVQRYLEKNGRALARDFFNFSEVPDADLMREPEFGKPFDWAAEMDAFRAECGNDDPWNGKRARTFKHFVLSPSPEDEVSLDELRELAHAWALRFFPEHHIAIIYHDDNENRIPHAHIVVNNTNVVTGRRMHTDNPLDLNRALQEMAAERGLQGAQQRKARTQHGLPATRGKQGRAQSESAHPAGDLPQPSRAKGRGGGRLLVGGGHQEQGGHREGPCQKRAGVPQHPRDDGSRDRGQLPPRAQAGLDLLARRRVRPPRIGRAPGRILRQGRAGEAAPRSEGRAPAGRILAGVPAPRQEGSRAQGPRRAGFALQCVRGLQQMAHHVPRRCRQRDRGATRQAAETESPPARKPASGRTSRPWSMRGTS